MTDSVTPLLTQVLAANDLIDPEAAAAETGLPVPGPDKYELLWLTLVALRAGLGLPSDPLRARGWLRFGRRLEDDEEAAPGDVAIFSDGDDDRAGIIETIGPDFVSIAVSPAERISIPLGESLLLRRPLAPLAA